MTDILRWAAAGRAVALRTGALGMAGLAVVGAAVTGPATATPAAPPATAAVRLAEREPDERSDRSSRGRPDRSADRRSDNRVDYHFQAQPNVYYCGPASTRIALSAHGEIRSQDELAAKLGTTVAGTASAFDVTRVLNETLGEDRYRTGEIPHDTAGPGEKSRLRTDLTEAVDDGRVPVVNVIGAATDTGGVQRDFPVGHYLTVVGYEGNGDQVRIADPAQPVGAHTYWISVGELAEWAASRGYSA